ISCNTHRLHITSATDREMSGDHPSDLRAYRLTYRCFAVDQPSHRAEGSKTMAKRRARPARHTIFTPGELAAHHRDMPKTRHGHPFAPDRVPPGFHTIV